MKWKLKKDLGFCGSGDIWYDLTDGGYIEPKNILDDAEQLKKLQNAISLVQDFIETLQNAYLLNVH